MMINRPALLTGVALFGLWAVGPCLYAQEKLSPNLASIPEGRGWKGDVAFATLATKDGAPAIEFNSPQDIARIIWLENFSFSNGVIEFDAKGQSAPPQSNFIGVAFRVSDATTTTRFTFALSISAHQIPSSKRGPFSTFPTRLSLGNVSVKRNLANTRKALNPRRTAMPGFTPGS